MSFLLNAVLIGKSLSSILNKERLDSRIAFRRSLLGSTLLIATWVTPFLSTTAAQSVQRSVAQDGVAFDIPVTAVCYPLVENQSSANGPAVDVVPANSGLEPAHLASNVAPIHLVSTPRNFTEVNSEPPAQPAQPAIRQYAARPTLAEQYHVNSAPPRNRFLLPIDATAVFSDYDSIDTVIFEVFPLSHSWRIEDYAPRSLVTTDYEGPISEELKADSSRGIIGDLKGGVPGYADLTLHVDGGQKTNSLTRQQVKPPHTQVVTSGLSQRGSGVFFKFHRSNEFAIEGGHHLELLLEVDSSWRGDVVQVHCRALDKEGNMFTKDFLMAVTIDGDWQSAEVAKQFANADRLIQNLLRQWQVNRRPTGMLSSFNAAISGKAEVEKPDSLTLARKLVAASSIEQIAGADRLPPSLRSGIETMIATKMAMLRLAQ